MRITSGVETSLPMTPDTGAAQEEYSDCTPESEPLYKPSGTVGRSQHEREARRKRYPPPRYIPKYSLMIVKATAIIIILILEIVIIGVDNNSNHNDNNDNFNSKEKLHKTNWGHLQCVCPGAKLRMNSG